MIVSLKPLDRFSPHCSVAGTICNVDGEVLILQSSDNKHHRGLWGLPAGKLEEGEEPLAGAIRETWEETSIELKEATFLCTAWVSGPIDFYFHLYETSLETKPPVALNAREHCAYQWLPWARILDLPLIPGASELFHLLGKDIP